LYKWLVAIAFSVLLLVPAGVLDAFGGGTIPFTPISIVFVKIDDNECKVFKIKGDPGPKTPRLIETVGVTELIPDSLTRPTMLSPTATHVIKTDTNAGDTDEFTYEPDANNNPTTPAMATLTVCPKPTASETAFKIRIFVEPQTQVSTLFVQEKFTDADEGNSFTFNSQFFVSKELPQDCSDKVTIGSTNVDRNTLLINCTPLQGGGTTVSITGTPINPMMPAIAALAIDPLGDTFLLVADICILFLDNSFVCPIDIDLNFEFGLLGAVDFGDAPDANYPTLLASNGARHILTASGPTLGPSADSEPDGQPTANADGDDMDGGPDENGVFVFPGPATPPFPPITQGGTLDIRVAPTGTNPLLDAWVDWNGDGDWTDAGEQIFASQAIAGPFTDLPSVNVPVTAAIGDTFMRFRVSTAGGLSTTGLALDGEVEDYKITIQADTNLDGTVMKTCTPDTQTEPGTIEWQLSIKNTSPVELLEVTCTGDINGVPEPGDNVVKFLAAGETFDKAFPTSGLAADDYKNSIKCTFRDQSGQTFTRMDMDTCSVTTDVIKPPVGGEFIPIETTSLLLASAQSFSWMIPVIVSAIGIGIVIARKF